MWKASQRLIESATQTAREAIEALRPDAPTRDRREAILDLLDAAGTLALIGRGTDARSLCSTVDHREVSSVIRSVGFSALPDQVLQVVLRAPQLATADGPERIHLFEEIRAALTERDRVAILLAGASEILGSSPELEIEQEAALLEFTELLKPELWRLVPLGALRAESVAWVDPSRRSEFWWWSSGAGIAASALDDLSSAAALIARFPEAREELERLIVAQTRLDDALRAKVTPFASAGPSRPTATVISLAEYLSKRLARHDGYQEDGRIRAAAAPVRREIFRNENVAVSWVAPSTLVIDVCVELCPHEAPVLVLGDGSIRPTIAVPETLDRFQINVAEVFDLEACIRLPLLSGTVLVPLIEPHVGS